MDPQPSYQCIFLLLIKRQVPYQLGYTPIKTGVLGVEPRQLKCKH